MDALDTVYFIGLSADTVLAVLSGALSFCRAQKRKGTSPFYHLLTGFFACVFMCNAYYMFTWLAIDYPYEFSPGAFSWVGAIVFLITAAMSLTEAWTPEQRQAARKYRLRALPAPAFSAALYAACILIYPEETAVYLLDAVPAAILAFYALWLYLAGKGGVAPAMRMYHLVVLARIFADLSHTFFTTLGWSYGWAVHATICVWLWTILTPLVYYAARKGAGA